MVVRTVGELARIGHADLGLRGELQIATRFEVTSMGLLVNPAVPANAGAVARVSQAAAQGLGCSSTSCERAAMVISTPSSNSLSNNAWAHLSSALTLSSLLAVNNSPS
jgi:hypothetical protein